MTAPAVPTTVASSSYRLSVAWLLMIVYTLNFMDRQVISVLLPSIQKEFAFGDAQGGLLHGTAFALFYVTLGIPIARWADTGNRVRIIAIATIVWSIMTALCGAARNFAELFVARVGVGVGEAGCSPAAYSILSGYFPPAERPGALSIYGSGIPLGGALGLALGGIFGQALGWRETFLIFGVPGIILALVLLFYVREPPRAIQARGSGPSLLTVLTTLWSRKSFRHATLGTSLLSFGGFAAGLWVPSFLIRTHEMPLSIVGISLATLTIIAGVSGTLVAGQVANRLVIRDRRFHMWLPAAAMLIGVPFSIIGLVIPAGHIEVAGTLIPNWAFVLAVFLIPTAAAASYIGPVMAAIQTMVAEPMRAMTTAIFLFVTNLIGLGGGPAIVGWVSDLLKAQFGLESLRISLLLFVVVNVWAALHFWLASRHVREDLALASDAAAETA